MELLTRVQAAERLGIAMSTLDALRASGKLGYIQHGKYGKVYITGEAVDAYLLAGRHEARAAVQRAPVVTFRKRRKAV